MSNEVCNQPVLAMAFVNVQRIGRVYSAEQALRRGTLYPELDKPFCGRSVQEKENDEAGRAYAGWAKPFAAWELRLYLDTHPRDERALYLYEKLCQITSCTALYDRAPWPWEDEKGE